MTTTCIGCEHCQRRFRHTTPRNWCKRFHRTAEARCLDYRSKRAAIQVVIDYYRQSSIK